jgi:hypothetical protein
MKTNIRLTHVLMLSVWAIVLPLCPFSLKSQPIESFDYPMLRPVQPPFTPYGAPPVGLEPNAYSPYANNPFRKQWPANDLELRRNIRTRFAQDSFLHPFGIHVEVREGTVTLTGTADTMQDKERSELDAFAAGAISVDNQLQTKSQSFAPR